MKKLALVAIGLFLLSGVAWAIDELDATKPASTGTVRDLGTYERETREKVNEIIDAISVGTGTWSRKTAAFTASIGDMIVADTRTGAFTITLPASPGTGTSVSVLDAFSSWDSYGVTLDGGAALVNDAETYTSYLADDYLLCVYLGSSIGWRVISFSAGVWR